MAVLMELSPRGYTLGKCLHRTPLSAVYEGTRDEDGLEVVFKHYFADRNRYGELRVQREFEAMASISSSGIPRPLAVDQSTEIPSLVSERVPGIPLLRALADGPLPLPLCLAVAVQIAEVLERVHEAGMMHRNITPAKILLDQRSARAWLIGFGRVCELGATGGFGVANSSDGFRYIAPEQTGRMNRGCDFRSDLYSFGATLYHALVGRPPFESEDALELLHCHMARMPSPPAEVRPDLPEAISGLVLELLSKEPADRYQSARALHADLVLCREQIERLGAISPDLELSDRPSRPCFSARLHGREVELARLMDLYERASSGERQVLLLSGDPGMGKTALVDSLRSELARTRGYMTAGKFDRYRERAYAGWVVALDALVQQFLTESDADIERWRNSLRAGLGSIAQALVDVIPDLAFILGDVPPVPSLGPSETLARLSLALQRFVSVAATPDRPLVLLLDDLQWGDAASLTLFEDIVRNSASAAVLVVGTCRRGEIVEGYPLREALTRLERDGMDLHSMSLSPITRDALVRMLADVLQRDPASVEGFADVVERKTGNVPLLVQQFVDYLFEQGAMDYERGTGWIWDSGALDASGIPEDAVGLMTAKIERLGAAPREILRFASCVGDSFDARLLSRLSGRPGPTLEEPLRELAREGLIIPSPTGFRFSHDRIREAARLLLSDAERASVHYQMARVLLASASETGEPARAIEVVDHLNQAGELVPDDLRMTHIELNLEASRSLLAAGAGPLAGRYLEVAVRSLHESDWSEHWGLVFDAHLQSAESAFQRGDVDGVFGFLDALERHPLTKLEFAQVVIKRVRTFALRQDPEECARYALMMLRKLGIRWPLRPSPLRARLAILVVRLMMRGREYCGITRPAEFDIERFAPLLILAPSGAVFLRVDLSLTVLASCAAMRRYIRWGYIGRPGFSVAVFGAFSYLMAPNVERARSDERAALYWNDHVPDPVYDLRARLFLSVALHPWLMPRRDALAPLERIAEQAREIGDPEFAYYASFVKVTGEGLAGAKIRLVERAMDDLAETVRRAGHWYPEPRLVHRAYRLLLSEAQPGEIEAALSEHGAELNEANSSASPHTTTYWMLVLTVEGRFDLVWQQSEVLGSRLERVVPFVHVADHTFLRGLAAADLATAARGHLRQRYRRALRKAKRKLRTWAERGPDFEHMHTFLEAESARLRKQIARARELYGQAAVRAELQGFTHHAALAHERRGEMLETARRSLDADGERRKAIALYTRWGATRKVQMLKQGATSADRG